MIRGIKSAHVIVTCALLFAIGCKQDPKGPSPESWEWKLPAHFPAPVYESLEYPISFEGVQLGRMLFYDPILSVDSSISCGSCHAQVHGFADHNTSKSAGVYGRIGKRNSPSMMNLAWQKNFMWDGGINHIEIMPLGPITDQSEMALELPKLISRLNDNGYYPKQFESVFGVKEIKDKHMFLALAQFMSAMISAESKYDDVYLGKANFEPLEEQGHVLFKAKCASCHVPPLFTDNSFSNNGMKGEDIGRELITSNPEDRFKFKVPSLRNINLTYPYMHNGSVSDLSAVIDHYNEVADDENLDGRMKHIGSISEEEKEALIAFLNTLTDFNYISNPELSEIRYED